MIRTTARTKEIVDVVFYRLALACLALLVVGLVAMQGALMTGSCGAFFLGDCPAKFQLRE